PGKLLGARESPLLEVARGQGGQAVECQQIGDRAQLAVFRGRRPEGARREIARRLHDAARVRHWHAACAGDGNSLQAFGPEDGTASLRRNVSGDLAATANLADVVSGVPTSGLNAKTSGLAGSKGSTPFGASRRRM